MEGITIKLKKIKLKNFRGYKDETEITFSNLTAFIGKNDAGKSTILEALEIFFNNTLVSVERDDLCRFAQDTEISISCVFTDLPQSLIIDSVIETTLESEYLLNSENDLEIKKVYKCTTNSPKAEVFIVCNHPRVESGNNLHGLKKAELIEKATSLNISRDSYNGRINKEIRTAIWRSFDDLDLGIVELPVAAEDSKKIYGALDSYLPIFALFQSDRKSDDSDKEVTDPMKIAIKQALLEVEPQLNEIKDRVRTLAVETATRTLEKLQEMAPEMADQLVPEFKTDPKFDSQFKLTIATEDGISINKRGSGVRRLILLNFFRAEAERLKNEYTRNQIIYAFEEPETSQHPNHQIMLIESFIELASSGDTQIILTTHTPALASLLPLNSLRYVEKEGQSRIVNEGTPEVFEQIANTLGILPDIFPTNTAALLLVEGKSDLVFINHTARTLKDAGFLNHTFEEKRFAILPVGGCSNLKQWMTFKVADQFGIPYCALLDSDIGSTKEYENTQYVEHLRTRGIRAYVTRKREIENYIHLDCLDLTPDQNIEYTEVSDAKKIIANAKVMSPNKVLEHFWPRMNADRIRSVEMYEENGQVHYEFTEMFNDFLSLV